MNAQTSDLAFAIRDFIEGQFLHLLKIDQHGDYSETGHLRDVAHVDVSDVNNPVIHLDNGQSFRVSVVAI